MSVPLQADLRTCAVCVDLAAWLAPPRWALFPDILCIVCSDNVDDALEKLQAAIDGAVESIQPIEIDPEKQKQLNKQ